MQIYQPVDGYGHNSDTIFLYDFVTRFLPSQGSLLEIGSGDGILGLLCVRDLAMQLTMIEREPLMAWFSHHNAVINGMPQISVVESDFLALREGDCGRFDVAISNPPFYASSVVKSVHPLLHAARYAENLPLEPMIRQLKWFLKPRGELIFCYDAKQSDFVLATLKKEKYNPEAIRFVHPFIDREASLLLCRAKLSSKSALRVMPPLIAHERQGVYSQEAQAIFKRAAVHSIKGERA